ncbi:ZIP family metal transporter [Pontibacillus litoralis]|uniref:Dihydroorotate dehydrogenase n=1 Tax=Pontibacillus litoralis JSM 072002 TaxID=1385512 RepID=A0A0A5G600_9BACI|nr:ZIP family metal transporter [Pontibacillus litoralis]KGX86593.1 dihydroorotate dehydrogenase [Pontibacillus litoralis JSM 072002]
MLFWWGIVLSACVTIIGALPVIWLRHLSHRGKDIVLAFTAGIMVAASTYGLIPAALQLSNLYVLVIGILFGTIVLMILEVIVPHHDLEHTSPPREDVRILLFLVAMSLHNVPEGLSVGMSYASTYQDLGPMVAFAIGLQNIPEGFLVALFLIMQKVSKGTVFFYTAFTAFIELCASMVGVLFGGMISDVVPYGLAFSAGAMLFIVYKELIPESHGDGNERMATFSFIMGFVVMVVLTNLLR